jgi:hypothetical protein
VQACLEATREHRLGSVYLTACAHDPLAVGVYLAIARCVTAGRGPVPIPAADLAAWEGGAHGRASAIRRYAHVTVETMRQVLTQLETDILRRAA